MAQRSKIRKTTIVDIAAASGVSVTTVSRILNDKPDVAEETRERVLRVMEEIGFAPQSSWQQIRSGRSHLIAMHFPQDFNPPAHRVIFEAALGCEDAGYSINIVVNPLSDNELLAIFRGGQADGMILMEIQTHDRRVEVLRQHAYPFVLIGRCADNTGVSFVDIDIERGVTLAMEHLIELGHRQIGFVTLSPMVQEKEYGYSRWALQSYNQGCQQYGLMQLWRAVDLNSDEAATAVQRLLDENPQITAILTPQEHCVIGVLKAIRAKGLRVPGDISVVGLLSDSMSELATPPLTTISFPSAEMGREAARILLGLLDGTVTSPQQVLIRPEL
ncbi:MAG TPA: LacI family DNA-binding transcriptional regulator, partial [Anaerolineae bacterium]|nr:LacI family DNA-binding transcriptional regulator [Anaerolineae bacterium]